MENSVPLRKNNKKRAVPLSCLGVPALRQLHAMGVDVRKYYDPVTDRKIATPTLAPGMADRMRKENKYNVSPGEERTMDGIKFASKLEMNAYRILKQYRVDFDRQPEIEIQPGFEHEGEKVRAIKYVADFRIRGAGQSFIVDTKGVETKEFRLKQKLLLRQGIQIFCIKSLGDLMGFLVSHSCLPKAA